MRGKYKIFFGMNNEFRICYNDTRPLTDNYWQSVNPVVKFVPTFMLQFTIIILFSRVLMLFLRPLRQPRFVAEILVCSISTPDVLYTLLLCY